VTQMPSPSIHRNPQQPTSFACALLCLYLLWAPVWFVAYLETVYGLFPSPSPVTGAGLAGRLAALVLAAMLPLPSWLGASLAAHSRRRGGGRAATASLRWNMVVGVLIVSALLGFTSIGLGPT
jgi:putative exporter of polyketide antibiotics